jgi:hypothetical protein
MSDYEAMERRKLQLALERIVRLEQAIFRATRRLDEALVRRQPDGSAAPPPTTSIIWELRAVAQASH